MARILRDVPAIIAYVYIIVIYLYLHFYKVVLFCVLRHVVLLLEDCIMNKKDCFDGSIVVPVDIAFAQKFFWEAMLTSEWDHIFQGFPEKNSFQSPILVKGLQYILIPEVTSWAYCEDSGDGDVLKVVFLSKNFDNHADSKVVIGMRLAKEDEIEFCLWPNSISFDVFIYYIPVANNLGVERFITPRIPVWRK